MIFTQCPTSDCSGKFFSPLRRSSLTKTVDSQTIRYSKLYPLVNYLQRYKNRLQEQVDDDRREAGRIPRTIDCELSGDLVDTCVPGDVVTVTAIVKATSSHDDSEQASVWRQFLLLHVGRLRSSKDKCTFLLYLEVISIINSKSLGDGEGGGVALDFSTRVSEREQM